MSEVNDYAEKVVREFIKDITDHVFCNIQSNEELMREYQSQVHKNSLRSVNTAIGKKVSEVLELNNESESENPKSWLIKGFTQHSK
ncbi:hypothetical protein BIZ37_23315 [Photobacterium sp. BZF1]|uniref:hypothetical protein n=1 Tax=Photobacterium sp. BZF1 TaxID=1904457 RepID=UPI0016535185|nr:hypothetical protein [Photobacterium sp. BZF1]MBC7005492.1 hypothetical protein [Photobacterium sp. BZF1]